MAQAQARGKAKGAGEEKVNDPLADPNNVKKLEATREFCLQLVRAIKSISLYKHATAKFLEFIEKPHQTLDRVTAEFGAISWRVETQWFTLFKQDLLGDEAGDNMPYKFYRDGIRHLIFRPGITAEELLKFTLIATSDTKRGDEDILSQLWAANFEHIEYVVVEGFAIGDMSEEEVQIEVDKVVGYLYNRLRSHSEDFLRFARVSAEDLDLKLEGVDQVRGAVISGETATDELKRRVKDELREDMELRLYGKLVTVLFQVIEAGTIQNIEELRDTFVQVLDALLLQEDFAAINQIQIKFKALERNSALAQSSTELRKFLIGKMGESQRLFRVGEILQGGKPKNAPDIFRYLMSLENTAVVPLLEILERVEIPDNRVLLCDALASLGKDAPEPFVNRLTSEKSQMVHDMLYVIDKCDFPDKLKIFGQALKSQNLAVRLEALGIISKSRTEGARKLVVDALVDGAPQVRVGAARALANFDREKTVVELMRVIKTPEFEKRELSERLGFYYALGSTNAQGALTFFQSMLQVKANLFNKKKVVEDKILAVKGLEGAASLVAFKLLQAVSEEKNLDPELLNAVRKAMFTVKKSLFGDPNANTDTAPAPAGKSS
jgi:HEAT repeat protein